MTQATMVLIFQNHQVLLAMKKRGFGAGRWNGPGGKVRGAESLQEAAVRETVEEIGVKPILDQPIGRIEFFNSSKGDWGVVVFRTERFDGEPVESDEMKPQWFPLDQIPYREMWPADRHWFPYVIDQKPFQAKFWFGSDDSTIANHEIGVVEQ